MAISGILPKIASSIYYCKFSRNDEKTDPRNNIFAGMT
ncbi:hypothetical protein RMAECT_0191 [Rickettsia rhipicephali str. Ect]|uniref:Uncharacterized protein n=1 Tax=Rickettsia rhipicephali str. Ect TaxID=1359199 RepID=A0A0F3PGT9_RICRH|nr:hypothetical protein RMAECT_0191 [Rickettsia rhipicephali str. Ect]